MMRLLGYVNDGGVKCDALEVGFTRVEMWIRGGNKGKGCYLAPTRCGQNW